MSNPLEVTGVHIPQPPAANAPGNDNFGEVTGVFTPINPANISNNHQRVLALHSPNSIDQLRLLFNENFPEQLAEYFLALFSSNPGKLPQLETAPNTEYFKKLATLLSEYGFRRDMIPESLRKNEKFMTIYDNIIPKARKVEPYIIPAEITDRPELPPQNNNKNFSNIFFWTSSAIAFLMVLFTNLSGSENPIKPATPIVTKIHQPPKASSSEQLKTLAQIMEVEYHTKDNSPEASLSRFLKSIKLDPFELSGIQDCRVIFCDFNDPKIFPTDLQAAFEKYPNLKPEFIAIKGGYCYIHIPSLELGADTLVKYYIKDSDRSGELNDQNSQRTAQLPKQK